MERIHLDTDFSISRIIKGGWQLSEGHSAGVSNDPVADMFAFVRAGVTTFDCADIYTGVEELIGTFLSRYRREGGKLSDIQVLTKFVPDDDALATLTKAYVEKVIDRSLKRLGLDQLDMVQFSWWNYNMPLWMDAALWLKDLQRAGKIRYVSGTNWNTFHTRALAKGGVPLKTLQVQYSVLDHRPTLGLTDWCDATGAKLLCYGTVAGGFLSERWLGVEEPVPPLETRSLVKYKLIVEDFGGWELFQYLLKTLKRIADRHATGVSNIAMRYILDQPAVGALIVGARTSAHLEQNLDTFRFQLSPADRSEIDKVLVLRKGPVGDAFDLERDREGRHGRIMRYNLNQISL